jgi:glycosyltransferase involved in cell wall biosynthesis
VLSPLRVGISGTVFEGPATHVQPDGISVYTRELVAAYALRDDVTPVPVVMGPRAARHVPAGATVLPHPLAISAILSAATGADFRGARRLAECIDVFHATDLRIPRLRRTPVCATLFDVIPLRHPEWANPRLRRLKNVLLRKSARWADHVIAISQAMVPELVEQYGIDRRRITVTPLGVNARWFERESASLIAAVQSRYSLRPGYLLFVGTLQPRKNIERILEAFERLPAPIAAGRQLVIAGKAGWRTDALVATLREATEGGRVRWLDYVDADDMRALYQGAAAFVFPSLYEGFGLPVLEAMQCGAPVIASRAVEEAAGDAAIYADTPRELASAMSELALRPELAAKSRERSLARAREFSWERTALLTRQVYEEARARFGA